LPETAGELEALAQNLKASADSLLLREEATEPNLRSVDLERYRVLAFATHAVVAGELKGLAEPALVLTPPEVGTEEDDDGDGALPISVIHRVIVGLPEPDDCLEADYDVVDAAAARLEGGSGDVLEPPGKAANRTSSRSSGSSGA
jgi:hypothetical protein